MIQSQLIISHIQSSREEHSRESSSQCIHHECVCLLGIAGKRERERERPPSPPYPSEMRMKRMRYTHSVRLSHPSPPLPSLLSNEIVHNELWKTRL